MLTACIAAEQPRQVLIFHTNDGAEKLKAQKAMLDTHRDDISDRDIRVQVFSNSADNNKEWKQWRVDSTVPFTFILVGRDGGEKLRSTDVVSAEKLFGLIDAMPMRKSEVKRRRGD